MKNGIFKDMYAQSMPDKRTVDDLGKRLEAEREKPNKWVYAISAAACVALITGIAASMIDAYRPNEQIIGSENITDREPLNVSGYTGSLPEDRDFPLSPTVQGMIYDYISKYSGQTDTLTAEIGNDTVSISIYDFLPMLNDYLSYECSEEGFEPSENSITLQWEYPDRDSIMYLVIDEQNGITEYSDEWGDSKNYFRFDSYELYCETDAEIKRVQNEYEKAAMEQRIAAERAQAQAIDAEISRQKAEEAERKRAEALRPQQETVEEEPYKTNANGLTYGSGTNFNDLPDLIRAMGRHGNIGYMRRDDYLHLNDEQYDVKIRALSADELEQAREEYKNQDEYYDLDITKIDFFKRYYEIPLFDESGENEIDKFEMGGGFYPYPSTVAAAKEEKRKMDAEIRDWWEKTKDQSEETAEFSENRSEDFIKLIPPVPDIPEITSSYGYGDGSSEDFHKGVDYSAENCHGMDIVAAADGIVTQAEDKGNGYGLCIIIDHGNDYTTLYAHCSELLVSEGDTVKAGDVIGKIGSSGFAYGDHCHFELRIAGHHTDPVPYIRTKNDT